MIIENKLAKPDKTIGQHSNELIEQAKLLYKLGYIKSDKLFSDLLVACKKHDYGKANSEFQKRVIKGGKFNEEKEIICVGMPSSGAYGYLVCLLLGSRRWCGPCAWLSRGL